jgi:hypothetical protein
MGEALIAEDTVLIKLIARRDALSEVIQEDARMGKSADLYIVKKVRSLTNQINELKELVVL